MSEQDSVQTRPKVSILVPAYNVERFVEQCMDSLVNQTLRDIEIIVINDGSTDSTKVILERYAAEDARVILVDKQNSGYGDSMNIGLQKARGEYVGIIEPDDFAETFMFEKLYGAAKANDLDIARGNYYILYTETGEEVGTDHTYVPADEVIDPKDVKHIFFQPPSVWANIYRRSFLSDNGIGFLPTPGASYQDTSFTFKVYSSANRFMMIPDRVMHYRIHPGSSTTQNAKKMFAICDEYNEIWRYIGEKGLIDRYCLLGLVLQYNGYQWNYKRLDDDSKKQFLVRWNKDIDDRVDSLMCGADRAQRRKLLMLRILFKFAYDLNPRKWLMFLGKNRLTHRMIEKYLHGVDDDC